MRHSGQTGVAHLFITGVATLPLESRIRVYLRASASVARRFSFSWVLGQTTMTNQAEALLGTYAATLTINSTERLDASGRCRCDLHQQ